MAIRIKALDDDDNVNYDYGCDDDFNDNDKTLQYDNGSENDDER